MDGHLPIGLKPKKRLGQNFLVDEKVVADLVNAADLTSAKGGSREDVVIEVGAGTGVLTKALAKRAGKILAFEIDHDLIPVLEKNLQEFDNVKVLNQDFLKLDKSILLCSSIQSSQFKIVGSIPYQITSPLIHKLLKLEPRPPLVVLLIQKEVAEKITARPPRATYLSNIVKLLGDLPALPGRQAGGRQGVEIIRFVPKTAFWPAPEVDGAIIKIVCSCDPCGRPRSIENFQKFLHRGFQHPRKMLRHKFDPEILKSVGIDPTRRTQTLEFDEWLKLYEVLK